MRLAQMKRMVARLAAAIILILFASAASASASVLIGDQGVAPSADDNLAGIAQAFVYTATATGTTGDAQMYVDTGTTATLLLVGVYADSGGKPGALIASGQLASPHAAAWNDVPLSAASLTSGTRRSQVASSNRVPARDDPGQPN